MVKDVFIEGTQLKLAEDRLFKSTPPAHVGLLIGKLSTTIDRGFIFDLILHPAKRRRRGSLFDLQRRQENLSRPILSPSPLTRIGSPNMRAGFPEYDWEVSRRLAFMFIDLCLVRQ